MTSIISSRSSFHTDLELAIQAEKLSKRINDDVILSNVDFSVTKGQVHGLIGANGSGKSTTMNILCGLIAPTSGVARINGANVRRFPEAIRRNVGYIPENPRLYPSLTVEETLNFIRDIYSVPKKESEPRISRYMEEFEVSHLREKYVTTLSKGELQKVMICSLMLREPKVVLLDEPFYALDPKSSKTFRRIIEEESGNGTTYLLATHLLDVAEKVCDSLTIIDDGRTIISGKIKDIVNVDGRALSLEEAFIIQTAHADVNIK